MYGRVIDLEAIRQVVGFAPARIERAGARAAAVLVPLIGGVEGRELELLLVRRSEQTPRHAGEIGFPGGAAEPEDLGPEATALRETEEELGVGPAEIEVFGELDGVITSSSFSVTPILGWISARPIV